MIVDTNLLIDIIRKDSTASSRLVIPIVVVGELQAFALKSDWGIQKVRRMEHLFSAYPIADVTFPITKIYAQVDALVKEN